LLIVFCVVSSTPAMWGECGVQDGHVQARFLTRGVCNN